MAYTKNATWVDYPSTDTLATAAKLNNIEDGIADAHVAALTVPFTRTWTADIPDGIIDTLGKVSGAGVFANPGVAGTGMLAGKPALVTASQSSTIDGQRTAEKAIDHSLDGSTGCIHTGDAAGEWWQLDALTRTIAPTRLALVGRGTGGYHPRNFKLQGSSDASAWTDLLTVTGDGPGDNSWWSSAVSGASAYRYLRILSTGLNSSATDHLVIGDVEIWGTVSAT